MQKSIAFKICLISGINFLSFACDSEVSYKQNLDKFAKPSTNNLALKKKRARLKDLAEAKKKHDSLKIVEKKKEDAKIAFPYTIAPPFSELKKELTTPIGKVSGDIFGSDNDVYAVSRTNCGDGSVLQIVYKSGTEFQVSHPISVPFLGLNTKKPVSHTDSNGFTITVNFVEDRPEKLAGSLRIDFSDHEGKKKNYIDFKIDGQPRAYLLPTKMKGKGTLPTYASCAPTAYVGIKQPTKDWVYGYAHIRNVGGMDLPEIRLMFSDRDGMDLVLIPLKRGQEIPANSKIDVATARKRGKNPAVLKIETWRIDEIAEPVDAIGANLNKLAKTLLLNGKATVGLKKAKPWNVDIRLEDFSISSMMTGPFQDEVFSEIRIFGNLGAEGEMKSALPARPDWWRKVDAQNPNPLNEAPNP